MGHFVGWQDYPRNQKSYYPLKDLKKGRDSEVVFGKCFGSQPSDVYVIDVQDGKLIVGRITSNDEHLDAVLLG